MLRAGLEGKSFKNKKGSPSPQRTCYCYVGPKRTISQWLLVPGTKIALSFLQTEFYFGIMKWRHCLEMPFGTWDPSTQSDMRVTRVSAQHTQKRDCDIWHSLFTFGTVSSKVLKSESKGVNKERTFIRLWCYSCWIVGTHFSQNSSF